MTKLKIKKEFSFSKIGMDEIEGMRPVIAELLGPVQDALSSVVYWGGSDLQDVPYKSCSGFIPHSHNCGGLSMELIIPKCEEYNFSFLEFGGYEHDKTLTDEQNEEEENNQDNEGHNDAGLRIWFKFEGLNEENEMLFYLYMGGGNNDAPYFRHAHETTIFESSFKAKTLSDLKKIGKKEIKKLLKSMGA